MASRRDLYQSYQFLVRRVVSGLVLRETDPAQNPLRRMGGAVFGSVMIAVLSLAVAGIIGVISPGGNRSWQEQRAVVVEEETGARFVWLPDAAGRYQLHPVVNFASGALLVGSTQVVSVSAASLSDVPRGPRLGIVGGPDSLPAPDRTVAGAWTLCSAATALPSGERQPRTALLVGGSAAGGAGVGGAAFLVRDVERSTLHLVWEGRQYPVPDEDAVLEGLTLRELPQVRVGTAWLSALPAGRPLAPTPVAGRGRPSAAVPGAVVGQVRVVQSAGGATYYQVAADAIVEITEVQAQVLLADPTISASVYGAAPPTQLPLSAAEANAAERVELPAPTPADPPADQPPTAPVTSAEETVCAGFEGGSGQATVRLGGTVDAQGAAQTGRRSADGTVLADQVLVAPGGGALVESVPSDTARTGALFLVTDEGIRYALPGAAEAAALGLGAVTPVRLPESLVARVPAGPPLDPADAAAAAG